MTDRDELSQAYRLLKPKYDAFVQVVESLVKNISDRSVIHTTSSRAKDEDSFVIKALRTTEKGQQRYDNPFEQIEDLGGVRVICFTVSQVDSVCEAIQSNFEVIEQIDKAKELIDEGRVGYVSKHFIVRLTSNRAELAEYSNYANLKCEIQVRTIFQHAWAEIEHRLQYKQSPDKELRARFQALAGFIQVADREFEIVAILGRSVAENAGDTEPSDVGETVGMVPSEGHALSNAAYLFGSRPSELVISGQYDKAIETYRALIAVQPNQIWHYVGRAKAYALSGRREEFLSDMKLIKDFRSKDVRVKDSLSRLREILP